ncbi:Chaperone protein YcdY [Klebsiella quasivariicola]|nr:Chaperone protein YcdY [Klebsiella quasivariicola]
MNEFSILCRVLGSLYYRQPQDPLLVPLFTLIREGKLAASWPLEQDELLARLQKSCDMQSLATDYNALFVGEACSVSPYRSAWVEGSSEAEVRAFLSEHGIPTGKVRQIILDRCCWPPRGWRIMPPKSRARRWSSCLLTISCPGAEPCWGKSKPMRTRRSGAPWRH